MINSPNKSNEVCKEKFKEDLKKKVIGELMEEYQEKLIENIQKQLNIKTTQIKNLRRHRNN
jgi:hypothetical protein